MRNVKAVTGYLDDSIAAQLQRGEFPSSIEVRPEPEIQDVFVRVSREAVADIRVGASRDGLTLIQLILREGAVVESIYRTKAVSGLRSFYDPVLNRVFQEATAKDIVA
jgi:hypothetical protein